MKRFLSEYGMVFILLGLCAALSVATLDEQVGAGAPAGEELGSDVVREFGAKARIVIVGGEGREDGPFIEEAARVVTTASRTVVARVQGSPRAARLALEELGSKGVKVDAIVASARAGRWAVLEDIPGKYPSLGPVKVLTPRPYVWPSFLKADNLRNIANQIAIIAILAVGMTLVIITGGIDLSVGSMVALAAVVAALLVRDLAGAKEASVGAMLLCGLAALAVCAALGFVNGVAVTSFDVPPFIATLGMMLMASGTAYLLAEGQSIYELPASATWLGRGADFLGVPNAVLLMLVLYAAAHLVMSRTTFGRYIYAVGGNREAARLSGVPVRRVLLLVYAICGAFAGLGGVVMASQFQSAAPMYGEKYEMAVVAAVVVGGTSIAGGEGKVLGTLIGAFIIAVIQNGMNLMGIQTYTQMVVLGAVIVGAVVLDRFRLAAGVALR
jgi:ribose transport system permease protein